MSLLFVIHVWHTRFPLNGTKKYLTCLDAHIIEVDALRCSIPV